MKEGRSVRDEMNIANRDTHGTSRLVNNDTMQVDGCHPLKDVSNLDRRVYNQIQGVEEVRDK